MWGRGNCGRKEDGAAASFSLAIPGNVGMEGMSLGNLNSQRIQGWLLPSLKTPNGCYGIPDPFGKQGSMVGSNSAELSTPAENRDVLQGKKSSGNLCTRVVLPRSAPKEFPPKSIGIFLFPCFFPPVCPGNWKKDGIFSSWRRKWSSCHQRSRNNHSEAMERGKG